MILKKYHCVKQMDDKDCGAACLATILKHYGSKISLAKIRNIAGTDTEFLHFLLMTLTNCFVFRMRDIDLDNPNDRPR